MSRGVVTASPVVWWRSVRDVMRPVVLALLVPLLCVGAEDCADDTGGTCEIWGCHWWRRAVCTKVGSLDYRCKCRPGFCAFNGVCKPARPANCPWLTGGTCNVFNCLPLRHATCEAGKCVCKHPRCARNGRCYPHDPDPEPKKLSPETCEKYTGTRCWSSCPEWSGAQCVGGYCQCGKSGSKQLCAVGPPDQHGKQCVVLPVRPSGMKSTPPEPNKVVLILSGGGAKGAYEYGMLRGLCENQNLKKGSKSWATAWTKIFGISIGALNAAGMAQFNFEEQCSTALDFLENFWKSIKTTEDVFIAATGSGREVCLEPNAIQQTENSNNWLETGGLCNADTGAAAFQSVVFADDIRSSGMQLRVGATNVNVGQMDWWNESSPDVVQGALASGRLAPLLSPMTVGEYLYIDGGFFTNTPILQAIDEGAKKIMVMFLSPIEGVGVPGDKLDKGLGIPVMTFILNVIVSRMDNEAELACKFHPDVQILAYIPSESPGVLTDFSAESIAKMIENGYRKALYEEPVDFCHHFSLRSRRRARPSAPMPSPAADILLGSRAQPSGFEERGIMWTQQSGTTKQVFANTMFFLCGALAMLAFQRQRQRWAAPGADSVRSSRPLLQQ